MENENSEDEPAGRGGEGGEDEFVFGLLLHAPIVTYPGGIARVYPKKLVIVSPCPARV